MLEDHGVPLARRDGTKIQLNHAAMVPAEEFGANNRGYSAGTARLDVRREPVWQRHPKIFAAFDKLPVEGVLEVVSDHEPRPLRYEFDVERPGAFLWDQRMVEECDWRVLIKRLRPSTEIPDAASFLRRSSLLAPLDEEARAKLLATAFERTCAAGETLVEQGDAFPYLGFVQHGVVAAVALSSGGREHVIYEALPLETFAELELLDGASATARMSAMYAEARVVLVPRDAMLEACQRSAMLSLRLGATVARRTRLLVERAGALAFGSTLSRIARALLPYARAAEGLAPAIPPLPAMTQLEIATLAGTVRVVAARGLAELSAAGAIEMRAGRVTSVDRDRLNEFAAL
jgi:CRP-like cAMP-binding protein/uncharacterized protein (DUF2249 family)